MGPLQLLLKVTRQCNLRCGYCNDWRKTSPVMGPDVLKRITDIAMDDPGSAAVAFIWHGGEPTLQPPDYFRAALRMQAESNVRRKHTLNIVQTNATLLTPEWVAFLVDAKVGLSISLDGPKEVHDMTRVGVGGRPTFDRVRDGMARLRGEGVPFGVLMVMSDELLAAGAARVWGLIEELGIEYVDFIPARPPNRPGGTQLAPTISPEFVTHGRWTQFMAEIFDLWWASSGNVHIKMLESVMSRLIGAEPELCIIGGGCFGGVFAVEPDGTLTTCDLFQGEKQFEFGSVFGTTFPEARASDAFRTIRSWNDIRLESLQSCPRFGLCNGGCPHNAIIYDQYRPAEGIEGCCGWRPLFEHLDAVVRPELARAERVLQVRNPVHAS
jgi:uncharacterized protein